MLLFVYGTLKRGCKNHHVMESGHTPFLANATTTGTLINLGPFPGFKRDGGLTIHGELFSVSDAFLRRADRFEGVPTMYTREEIQVRTEAGQYEMAYVYEVTDETIQSYRAGNRVIPSGIWVE